MMILILARAVLRGMLPPAFTEPPAGSWAPLASPAGGTLGC